MHGERTIVSFAVQSKQTLYDTHHTTNHTKRAKTQIGTRILHSSPQVVGLLFFDQMGFTSEGRQFSWLFLSGHGASVAHYAPAEGCGYVPAREQTDQSATGHLQAARYDHTSRRDLLRLASCRSSQYSAKCSNCTDSRSIPIVIGCLTY